MEQEKQQKIINLIKRQGGSTTLLGTKKDDECYTAMEDILIEMNKWAELGKFNGKNIICPCDWDIVDGEEVYSITIEYKNSGVDVFGNAVQKASIKYDLWSDSSITTIEVDEDSIDEFLRNKLTCNFLRTFTQNARKYGIKSITASGFNPANGKGVSFEEVDYSKYDICCTNPPFSMYPEFMECMMKSGIDFIVLAPAANRTNPSIGVPLMTHRAYLGWNLGDMSQMKFVNPTTENKYKEKTVCCDWLTSYSEGQESRNERNRLRKTYDYKTYKDEFYVLPHMKMIEGSNPIKVNASLIPENYDGWMFSSSYVLDFLTDEYEWYGTNFSGYFNKEGKYYHIQHLTDKITDKVIESPFANLKENIHAGNPGESSQFAGIVFRRKIKNNS